ncbi:unnamed protein product [Effrenium voratum]|nr:unnamed protein product [Effrenium voratum]
MLRRKQSLQRVHEEGKRVFDELSEKLYTLEVQKNDVDEEVGRLQALVSDLETQLSSVKRQRDELKRSSAASTARPSEGPDLGVAIGQRSSKAFTAFTASVTSDTRSRASLDSPMQKPGTPSSSSDPAAFFGTGSRPTTELRSSPKTHLMQGVVKVLAPSTFINPDGQPKLAKKAKTPRSGKRTTRGDLEAFGMRPSLRHDDAEEESEPWRRRPSQSVRRSQSAAAPSREDHLGTAGKLAAGRSQRSLDGIGLV